MSTAPITMNPARWENTERYLQEVFGREDDVLRGLREAAAREGLPDISVSADVGRLLSLLVKTTGARNAIELGTLGGYSGLWIARALRPDGRLVTVDVDARRSAFARGWFEKAGVSTRVETVTGPALEVLPGVLKSIGSAGVDVAFFDAVKTEYIDYFRAVRDAINAGGLLIADNALGSNQWWIDTPESADQRAVDAFNRAVASDPDFETACVPIRQGVLIARRKHA
jgi:predicted O-methyltransferase YrrM